MLRFIAVLIILFSFTINNNKAFYPSYFPKPVYDYNQKKLNPNTIELGRHLFYDPILSVDSTISCASCHSSFNAFAHSDHELSHGLNDEIGNRNAPALFNLAWQKNFMWDGSIKTLELQALAPINHPKEMGESVSNILKKLNKSKVYKQLFTNAFNDSIATNEKLLTAISQFQLTLISANTKYDNVILGKDTFTTQEKNGYNLFKSNCNSCHKEPMFTNYLFANNGLAIDTILVDYGKGAITKKSTDSLLFKVPTLRNLSYSLPYMHDGRFKTIREVILHYTIGIKRTQNLSPILNKRIKLTSNERVDLQAFILTLNDNNFIYNKKFQHPEN